MKNFRNISSIILLLTLVISIFLNVKSCTKIDVDKYKSIEDENKRIELIRDSLFKSNEVLKIEFRSYQDSIDMRNELIDKLKVELNLSKNREVNLRSRTKELENHKLKSDLKIKELESNPVNREGDALINSLKNKL